MSLPESADHHGPDRRPEFAAATASLVAAVALFSRFGIGGTLNRDESIYAYAGQQLSHGVPPYVSIFDPKMPLESMIAGLAAGIARVVGSDDIYAIRVAFFACACLTALAVYLLAARLWRSALAGVVAAVVFASFNGFAEDALAGPDAKTPGILAAVLAMWFLVRRQWFWGAFAGSLAFLVWQPLVIYLAIAPVVALLASARGERWTVLGRAVAGGAIPLIAVTGYFAAKGALGDFLQATFVFPATGVRRSNETVGARLSHIAHIIHDNYGFSSFLILAGWILLILLVGLRAYRSGLRGAVHDPLVCVVLVTFLSQAAYAAYDFQGYPDVYPLLPYPALGLGGAAAVAMKLLTSVSIRRGATVGVLVAAAALIGFSWSWFSTAAAHDNGFRAQRADACAVETMLGAHGRLYSFGSPIPLVMTHRRNPDRFIYLRSGVDAWKVGHTTGGFNGWVSQVRAAHPQVVAVGGGWDTRLQRRMVAWLHRAGYSPRYVGAWHVFLNPAARRLALVHKVKLTGKRTRFATDDAGSELSAGSCG